MIEYSLQKLDIDMGEGNYSERVIVMCHRLDVVWYFVMRDKPGNNNQMNNIHVQPNLYRLKMEVINEGFFEVFLH